MESVGGPCEPAPRRTGSGGMLGSPPRHRQKMAFPESLLLLLVTAAASRRQSSDKEAPGGVDTPPGSELPLAHAVLKRAPFLTGRSRRERFSGCPLREIAKCTGTSDRVVQPFLLGTR